MISPGGSRGGAVARRPAVVLVAVLVGAVVVLVVLVPLVKHFVRELTYPLRYATIIRREARVEHLDPALIAAVIYAESKFDARTSSAGALGLMQILPSTSRYLANLSGGTQFRVADLTEPAVNIAYGSYYLRYLLNRYGGSETLALAAYNAGATNVNEWLAVARSRGEPFDLAAIPFSQTRAYVAKVEAAQLTYRKDYSL